MRRALSIFAWILILTGCSTNGTQNAQVSALISPGSIGADVTLAIQLAEMGLPAKDVAVLKFVAPIAGSIVLQVASGSGSMPTSAALSALVASKLSGKDAKIVAIIQALLANPYSQVYARFAGDVTKAAPYLTSIGTALETA
jgi:hypothetical protein